jgi:hypothetical protein
MSEDEEEDIVPTVHATASQAAYEAEAAKSMHMDEVSFTEPVSSPKFAEMAEPHFSPGNGMNPAALEERRPLPTGGLFEENTDRERDLEVPTFMRRSPLF